MDEEEIKTVVEETILDALEYVLSESEEESFFGIEVEEVASEAMGYLEEYGFFEDYTASQLKEALSDAMRNNSFDASEVTRAFTSLVEWLADLDIHVVED